MANRELDESVIRADRLSKPIALLFAVGVFLVATLLSDDALFNMIVAAFAGIGVRIYIPYHAIVTVDDPDHPSIEEFEVTGNYHHGAVGAAVVVAAAVAIAAIAIEPNTTLALAVGAGSAVVFFFVFRRILPS